MTNPAHEDEEFFRVLKREASPEQLAGVLNDEALAKLLHAVWEAGWRQGRALEQRTAADHRRTWIAGWG